MNLSGGVMARARDVFQLALEELRSRLRGGRHVQGEQLVITDIARDLHLSPTPVREAMARLAGEGLIEDRRGRGYFAWKIGATEILEIYGLHHVLVAAALSRIAAGSSGTAIRRPTAIRSGFEGGQHLTVGEQALAVAEQMFDDLIHGSGDQALRSVYGGVRDRLAPIRRVEVAVLPNVLEELGELGQALADGARSADCLVPYHVRRRDAANGLAWVLRAQVMSERKE